MSSETRGVRKILDRALAGLPEALRARALTHVSYANEKNGAVDDNERLEFLGDAVLYLSCGHYLYMRYPNAPEGDLTRMRASVVSGQNLAQVALAAGLGEKLLLGRGEETSGGRTRTRLLAGALEAVVGAVYLHGGWEAASALVEGLLLGHFSSDDISVSVPVDPKTLVQEQVQRMPGITVEYRVLSVEGPPHMPLYTVACLIGGTTVSTGRGSTKKEAEEASAAEYLKVAFEG